MSFNKNLENFLENQTLEVVTSPQVSSKSV